MPSLRFVLGRLLSTFAVLVVVSTVVFMLARLTGDPAAIIAGENASADHIQEVREQLGRRVLGPLQVEDTVAVAVWNMAARLGSDAENRKPGEAAAPLYPQNGFSPATPSLSGKLCGEVSRTAPVSPV